MKWVKASERLPEDKWEIVCIKTDGGGAPYYQPGDRASIEHEMEAYIPTLHAYETQWLDESDQSEDRDKETAEFAWWASFNGWKAGIYEEGLGWEKITHTFDSADQIFKEGGKPSSTKREFSTEIGLLEIYRREKNKPLPKPPSTTK